MSRVLAAIIFLFALTLPIRAETVGVAMSRFEDNFLTTLRNGIVALARQLEDVDLKLADGLDDQGIQNDQVLAFIADGVDAIILNPVDTSATEALSVAASAAGIPLVFVNRMPVNVDRLPDGQAFVASDERESGRLQTIELCRRLASSGRTQADAYIMIGQEWTHAAQQRTQDIHDVISEGLCAVDLRIIDQQTAGFHREPAEALMTRWLESGRHFDAVIANNDEMALGAIAALKDFGVPMHAVEIGGIDATRDGLRAMTAGELDVTVFQNAAAQGAGALDAALKLARGQDFPKKVFIPFELVTPENIGDYMSAN